MSIGAVYQGTPAPTTAVKMPFDVALALNRVALVDHGTWIVNIALLIAPS